MDKQADNSTLERLGYSINPANIKSRTTISPIEPSDSDFYTPITSGGYFGHYLEQGGESNLNEFNLIKTYREMSLLPEVDSAIDDIVNEAITSDHDEPPVIIDLTKLRVSDNIKNKIREEFDTILTLLDFDDKAHQIFRRWYVDGRLFFHKIIDLEKPIEGIKELRFIDPLKIKKVRVKKPIDQKDKKSFLDFGDVDEFYVYKPNGFLNKYLNYNTNGKSIKLSKDAVTFVPSGATDYNNNIVVSYLHKAIKASNQLQMMEDSIVLYRVSRAPERRIFYIDVGNLPTPKAEQYMKEIMNRYRTKVQYDANTGYIKNGKKHMSMLEDYFIPRKDSSKGTEITTLPGGQSLGELDDVKYFQKKLYQALNIPPSRLESDNTFNIGRGSEISRDELKFAKFIGRLRKKFSHLFLDILKSQLILKNIIKVKDWEVIKEYIQFDFIFDNHFNELKDLEILNERLNAVASLEQYVGKYYSHEYLITKILKQSDREKLEIQEQIQFEKDNNLYLSKDEEEALLQQEMEDQSLEDGDEETDISGNDINAKFEKAFKNKEQS